MLPSWFGWRACSQCFGISSIFPLVLKFVLPFAVLSVAFAALIFADVSGTFGVLWVALILACLGGASPLGMALQCFWHALGCMPGGAVSSSLVVHLWHVLDLQWLWASPLCAPCPAHGCDAAAAHICVAGLDAVESFF